jgi:hypothetical protein
MRLARIFLLLGVAVSACGCTAAQATKVDSKETTEVRTLNELRSAPEQLEFAGRQLKLEAYLYRDFMPSVGASRPSLLIGSIKLKTVDDQALPKGVQVEAVWVINGYQSWTPAVKEVRKGKEDSASWEIVVRDGPPWAPGIQVDVIVLLKDEQGQSHLLRASDQKIQRMI